MSSKRKRNQGENNGSNRNLDGRRLRTVTEAKALAEYLAVKPEMDKKEKEIRRKRWEQIVVLAERKEEEIQNGLKGRINGQWVEDKEEANERTREAVFAAMRSGIYQHNNPESSIDSSPRISDDDTKVGGMASSATIPRIGLKGLVGDQVLPKSYFGFDEDDEFLSDDDEADKAQGNELLEDLEMKDDVRNDIGKGKA